MIYEGSFDSDCAGIASLTPFIPLSVGDYIDDRRCKSIMGPMAGEGETLRVTAVKHSFQDLGSHIAHDVEVCVEAVPKPASLFRLNLPPGEPLGKRSSSNPGGS
jgi:hypothetical protein